MKKPPLAPAARRSRDAKIQEMLTARKPDGEYQFKYTDIATIVGCSPSAVSVVANAIGHTRNAKERPGRGNQSPAGSKRHPETQAALDDIAKGMTVPQAAKKHGVALPTLYNSLRLSRIRAEQQPRPEPQRRPRIQAAPRPTPEELTAAQFFAAPRAATKVSRLLDVIENLVAMMRAEEG